MLPTDLENNYKKKSLFMKKIKIKKQKCFQAISNEFFTCIFLLDFENF